MHEAIFNTLGMKWGYGAKGELSAFLKLALASQNTANTDDSGYCDLLYISFSPLCYILILYSQIVIYLLWHFEPSISLLPKKALCVRINIFCTQESSWGQQNMLQIYATYQY